MVSSIRWRMLCGRWEDDDGGGGGVVRPLDLDCLDLDLLRLFLDLLRLCLDSSYSVVVYSGLDLDLDLDLRLLLLLDPCTQLSSMVVCWS